MTQPSRLGFRPSLLRAMGRASAPRFSGDVQQVALVSELSEGTSVPNYARAFAAGSASGGGQQGVQLHCVGPGPVVLERLLLQLVAGSPSILIGITTPPPIVGGTPFSALDVGGTPTRSRIKTATQPAPAGVQIAGIDFSDPRQAWLVQPGSAFFAFGVNVGAQLIFEFGWREVPI